MPTPEEIDEILEIVWTKREKNINDLDSIKKTILAEGRIDVLNEMENEKIIKIERGKVSLTDKGESMAQSLIRNHRLAERLLVDVLEAGYKKLEETACKFEHVLSTEITDSICTLLGHPRECPHGLPIPEGQCCRKAKTKVESIVGSLDKIDVGEEVSIAYILTKDHPRLHKLMSFGISPGVKIKMHQKFPSYVIQIEETQIALEKEIVKDIYVRKK
jgi:DtxR family Mn-dependent transcriptional regulator